jgi:hypothetical protein
LNIVRTRELPGVALVMGLAFTAAKPPIALLWHAD